MTDPDRLDPSDDDDPVDSFVEDTVGADDLVEGLVEGPLEISETLTPGDDESDEETR
ncbi:hypothetical protein G6M89_05120 [Natronolimnobius sp. AArcel1]|uniref:hypothetical protein n=1 Tax=Natronolimnobius sp. AArcel1 TaxID=1679093 RepID=UPI0013EABB5F|nr:hypothetical protein [Natronolimnobius sp. AArcel1]NGM68393.1 hypothetical protein [Natronolimnobius sp. AArcel1]